MTREEHHDAHLLAAKSGADIRTVRRWLSGGSVSNVSRESFERWADELGIQRPAPATTATTSRSTSRPAEIADQSITAPSE